MALMSPPIAVADATPVNFDFSQYRASVNVQTRFYSDAAGLVEVTPGTGSRDISATNVSTAYEGDFSDPGTVIEDFVSAIDGGAIAGAVDGRWYELTLGGGLDNVTLTAAANTTPGTAVTYRVFVDAPGSSSV